MNDPRIQSFRKALNEWKRRTFFEKLVKETDSESINRRIEEAHRLYRNLMTILDEAEQKNRQLTQIGGASKQEIQEILNTLGPQETWTESMLDSVRSILITDLFEYPLTFNSTLIDQFKATPNFPIFE